MTSIEWVKSADGSRGQTWNPVIGCSIVSPGCTNCYAMQMAARCEAMGTSRYDGTTKRVKGKIVWTGKLARAPEATLLAPLKRKKPTTYFVNSMGDLFHEDCPDEWIDQLFAVMALCPQHTFQVLTKRAKRMRQYLTARNGMGNAAICRAINAIPSALGNRHGALEMPLPNVWLGVSTERQQEADERIPLLLQTPATVRFISAEPLLEPINLFDYIGPWGPTPQSLQAPPELDWVIVGGESGADARPMHPDWARSLCAQCAASDVPFFFKQWGEYGCIHNAKVGMEGLIVGNGVDDDHNFAMVRCGKHAAGRHLDGQLHDAMPLTAPRQRTDDRSPIQN